MHASGVAAAILPPLARWLFVEKLEMASDSAEISAAGEVGDEEDKGLGVEGEPVAGGEEDPPAGKKDAIELAPVRLSLPSKVLGVSWLVIFYLFLEEGPLSYGAIGTIIVAWSIWELHWRRLWARQREEAAALFEKLRQAQEGGGGEGALSQLDVLRQLQQLAFQVAFSTTQTPLRCFVESLIVLAGAPPPILPPPGSSCTAATKAPGDVRAVLHTILPEGRFCGARCAAMPHLRHEIPASATHAPTIPPTRIAPHS